MNTWAFPGRRELDLFAWLVRPIIGRTYSPRACRLVLRVGLALVGARRAPGRHYRDKLVTAEVACP